jgi:hypothetical protein
MLVPKSPGSETLCARNENDDEEGAEKERANDASTCKSASGNIIHGRGAMSVIFVRPTALRFSGFVPRADRAA